MDKNIVLIGMPGSGKTSVGRVLSKELNMLFVDLDKEIESYLGNSIREVFAEKGEEFFRNAETICAKKVSKKKGQVIATGGGIVLREENMKALKENAVTVFLDRPIEDILKEDLSNRPLLAKDSDKIYKIYTDRINLYKLYSDMTVESKKSVKEVALSLCDRLFLHNVFRMGVIGDPIAHTLSPQIHTTLSEYIKVPCEYTAHRVEKDSLGEFVNFAKNEGFSGFNVTIPHKNSIIDFLDECDESAKKCNAVNTVCISDGKLKGYNTDGEGLYLSLKQKGISVDKKYILLLGAGGASVSICQKLVEKGADVTVLCRSPKKAEKLFENQKTKVLEMTKEIICKNAEKADIIINATPLGMDGIEDNFTDFSFLDKTSAVVYDIVYKPFETALIAESKKRGLKAFNGLSMLINQAIYAFSLFTNSYFDIEKVSEYLQEEMKKIIYK